MGIQVLPFKAFCLCQKLPSTVMPACQEYQENVKDRDLFLCKTINSECGGCALFLLLTAYPVPGTSTVCTCL